MGLMDEFRENAYSLMDDDMAQMVSKVKQAEKEAKAPYSRPIGKAVAGGMSVAQQMLSMQYLGMVTNEFGKGFKESTFSASGSDNNSKQPSELDAYSNEAASSHAKSAQRQLKKDHKEHDRLANAAYEQDAKQRGKYDYLNGEKDAQVKREHVANGKADPTARQAFGIEKTFAQASDMDKMCAYIDPEFKPQGKDRQTHMARDYDTREYVSTEDVTNMFNSIVEDRNKPQGQRKFTDQQCRDGLDTIANMVAERGNWQFNDADEFTSYVGQTMTDKQFGAQDLNQMSGHFNQFRDFANHFRNYMTMSPDPHDRQTGLNLEQSIDEQHKIGKARAENINHEGRFEDDAKSWHDFRKSFTDSVAMPPASTVDLNSGTANVMMGATISTNPNDLIATVLRERNVKYPAPDKTGASKYATEFSESMFDQSEYVDAEVMDDTQMDDGEIVDAEIVEDDVDMNARTAQANAAAHRAAPDAFRQEQAGPGFQMG